MHTEERVAGIGGRNIAHPDSPPFVKAIEIALDSYPGSFSSIQGRQYKESALVTSLSMTNALYRKETIVEMGCFDESLRSESEDAELNFRLVRAGHKLFYVPDAFVWHNMRSSPHLWFKNMFRYGKGRARLLKRNPKMWNISYLLPLVFLASMLSIFLSICHWIFTLPALYFVIITLFSFLHALKKKSLSLVFYILLVYLVQHFGYALGETYGLISRSVK